MKRRLFLAAVPALFAAGCGFQLRRSDEIPFASLYIDAPPGSAVAQHIRNSVARSKTTRLAKNANEADAVLKMTQEQVHAAALATVKQAKDAGLHVAFVTEDTVRAPFEAGQKVGVVKVWRGANVAVETPVYAMDSVDRGSTLRRAMHSTRRRRQPDSPGSASPSRGRPCIPRRRPRPPGSRAGPG